MAEAATEVQTKLQAAETQAQIIPVQIIQEVIPAADNPWEETRRKRPAAAGIGGLKSNDTNIQYV